MSKAEEKSEQYRAFREQCGIKDPIMLNEIEEACYEGYLQAEKDLALTCADVALLQTVFNAIDASITLGGLRVLPMTEEYYQEVLKRFHETKNK